MDVETKGTGAVVMFRMWPATAVHHFLSTQVCASTLFLECVGTLFAHIIHTISYMHVVIMNPAAAMDTPALGMQRLIKLVYMSSSTR